MTQDEIIEMARTSGFMPAHNNRVQHFAKLVAAKEREECADLLEHGYIDDEGHHLQYAKEIRARGKA
jgi:hypothetical protein